MRIFTDKNLRKSVLSASSAFKVFSFSLFIFFSFLPHGHHLAVSTMARAVSGSAEVVFEKILDATVVARRQLIEAAGDIDGDFVVANDVAGDGEVALCLEIHF